MSVLAVTSPFVPITWGVISLHVSIGLMAYVTFFGYSLKNWTLAKTGGLTVCIIFGVLAFMVATIKLTADRGGFISDYPTH